MTGKDLIIIIKDNGLEQLDIDGECSGDHNLRFSISLEENAYGDCIWTDKVVNLVTGEVTIDTNMSDSEDVEILD